MYFRIANKLYYFSNKKISTNTFFISLLMNEIRYDSFLSNI